MRARSSQTSSGTDWPYMEEDAVCEWPRWYARVSIRFKRERELRKEGREVPSRVRLREGPIGVRITLGQPTIG